MISHAAWLTLLAFFSGLSINFILQCSLGMAGFSGLRTLKFPLVRTGLCFAAIVALWLLFSYVLSPLAAGFFGYIVLFPVAALLYSGAEYLLFDVILKDKSVHGETDFFYQGLGGAVLFITLNLADNFTEAFSLSLGFAVSLLLTQLVLGEIYRHAAMEAVPRFLRGSPLTIISMGLLSLICGSAAIVFFRALGG